jgi:UDP-N-acetylglucosamine acyltransferase
VDPKAQLAENVEVGPFCTVGPDVVIGAGTRLLSNVVVTGHTRLGTGNIVHPFAVLGGMPQDLKYGGEPTRLEMGDGNIIRENVTIHTGTVYGSKIYGGGVTRVGDGNLLMVNAHVGHDVQIGNRCIIANNVMLAGHVVVGNHVILNGAVGVNAFVTIGDFAYIGGAARIHHDVPPFVKVSDDDKVRALNATGLKRQGLPKNDIEALEDATRTIFFNRQKSFAQAMADFDTMNGINPYVKTMVEFLRRRDEGKHGRYLESLRQK